MGKHKKQETFRQDLQDEQDIPGNSFLRSCQSCWYDSFRFSLILPPAAAYYTEASWNILSEK
jgi:hypothetical protein